MHSLAGVAFKDNSLLLYDAASWVPLMDLSAELAPLASRVGSDVANPCQPASALLFTRRTAGLFLTTHTEYEYSVVCSI